MIPAFGDVVEIRPLQLAGRCCIQQQAVHVVTGAVWHRRQAPQALDGRHVAVAVDGNEACAYQRRFVGEAAVKRHWPITPRSAGMAAPLTLRGLVRLVER